jgi:sugar phosphate isomerase/epimerase
MQLSCASPMVPGDTLTAKAMALRNWGFDAISVFWPYDQWTEAVREELIKLPSHVGVTPCEFAFIHPLYGRLMDPDPEIRSQSRAMYIEAARVCVGLDMVTELEFEYGPQDPLPLFHPYQKASAQQLSTFVEAYRSVADAVAETGALVLLEPLNRYESRYLNSVTDCVEVLEALEARNTGLLFDFFHAAIEEADVVAAIKRAGSHIKHVHVADNNRLPPGCGSMNWEPCFAALQEVGFDGYVALECATGGDAALTLPSAAQYLRGLMG